MKLIHNRKTLACALRVFRILQQNPEGVIVGYERVRNLPSGKYVGIRALTGMSPDSIREILSFLMAIGVVKKKENMGQRIYYLCHAASEVQLTDVEKIDREILALKVKNYEHEI